MWVAVELLGRVDIPVIIYTCIYRTSLVEWGSAQEIFRREVSHHHRPLKNVIYADGRYRQDFHEEIWYLKFFSSAVLPVTFSLYIKMKNLSLSPSFGYSGCLHFALAPVPPSQTVVFFDRDEVEMTDHPTPAKESLDVRAEINPSCQTRKVAWSLELSCTT